MSEAELNRSLTMDARALANELGVSEECLEELDAKGKIPRSLCFGGSRRWVADEIAAWLAEGGQGREGQECETNDFSHDVASQRGRGSSPHLL